MTWKWRTAFSCLFLSLLIPAGTFAVGGSKSGPDQVRICVGKRDTAVSAKSNGRCPRGATPTVISRQGSQVPAGPATTNVTPPVASTNDVIDGGRP